MDTTKREELEKAYRKERDSRVVLRMVAVHMRCDSQLADSPQLGGRMAPTGSNITTIVLDYARIR